MLYIEQIEEFWQRLGSNKPYIDIKLLDKAQQGQKTHLAF